MALHFEPSEFSDRMQRTLIAMAEAKLDGLLIFSQESMYWLTGYDTFGFCFFQCLVLRSDGQMALLTRTADLRQAQLTSIIKDIRVWTDGADAQPAVELADLVQNLGLMNKRLGIETATQGLTYANGRAVHEALDGNATLVDAPELIGTLRRVKSDAEIAYVRKASELCDASWEAALATIKPGAYEGDVLAAMHSAIFKGGGDYPGNEFIIGSGDHALLCRYQSGRRTLGNPDQITLEWAGTYRHYHVAGMRTVCVGAASDRHRSMHQAALDALLACEEEMVPGRTFGDVFAAHAETFAKAGLTDHRLAACGYSLGARFTPCWMDWPMFYEDNPAVIEPNMVLFAHMILADSDTGTAMTLGRTSLTTATGSVPLSEAALEIVVKDQ
ncbi:MAG: Xaa-Pro peptidase family protein [Pseudomonadota bacterium]